MIGPTVRFLPRRAIDAGRWDATVDAATNGKPYGLSWWLDATTDGNWWGLVLDDYRTVLAVPHHLRLGPFALVNGAPFTQQTGPFGNAPLPQPALLLTHLPRTCAVRQLDLGVVPDAALPPRFRVRQRTNLVLDLDRSYTELFRSYRKNIKQKLRGEAGYVRPWRTEDFLAFYFRHTADRFGMPDRERNVLAALCAAVDERGRSTVLRFTDGAGQPLGGLYLVRHGRRLVNLLATSSPAGLTADAMARLLDHVIRTHAGTDLVLDFEGSDLRGVATFFRGFGARPEPYLTLSDRWL